MPVVFVTGMSGTGKSSTLAELARRGFPVVDTDHGGYTVELPATPCSPAEQLWREDRIEELLSRHGRSDGSVVFLAGCVSNQRRFHDRFDAVVLLSAPVDVIVGRIATRTTNDFGKSAEDRERILADLADVEPRLRAVADLEIDTRRPLAEVVDDLVRLAGELPRKG